MEDGAAAGPSGPFEVNDMVLAPQGGKLYEAKILKGEHRNGTWYYFIHYQGWNKKWDEWLKSDVLLPDTPENKKQVRAAAAKAAKVVSSAAHPVTAPRPSKRKAGDDDAGDGGGAGGEGGAVVLRLPLPGPLKKQLIDDWEAVTELGKRVTLPRDPTVRSVLQRYAASKGVGPDGTPLAPATAGGAPGASGSEATVVHEIVCGLLSYFDRAVPAILLYRQERRQHAESMAALGETGHAGDVYGAEHLLRLFVKMPELVPYTAMEATAVDTLQVRLADLLKFMLKHQGAFFQREYEKNPDAGGEAQA